jgi:3-hydroxyisobutyrate dehydrogenase-like beta-hydroxyacid dehydrogenase
MIGIGQDKVVSFIENMYPNTPLVNYVKKMAGNEYGNISFRVAGVKKDLRHIIQLGADYNVDMSVHKTMLSNYDEVERLKGDDLDITSVVGGKLRLELYFNASDEGTVTN